MSETMYLVYCRFAENIEEVIGPFVAYNDAEIAANAIEQFDYNHGDKHTKIVEKEVIQP